MIAMHPGEYLREAIIDAGLSSQRELATKIGASESTVSRILSGEVAVTAEMALKLEGAFGRSAESWLKMQNTYDLTYLRERGTTAQDS